jgi:hypothetical protein
LATLEPFALPPCGIRVDKVNGRARSARELHQQGCTPIELRQQWGFSAMELAQAGLNASQLLEAGVTTREMAASGSYSAAECRYVGCTVLDLLGARFGMQSLISAGFGPADFRGAGLSVGATVALGFDRMAVSAADDAAPPPPAVRPPASRGGSQRRPRTAPASRAHAARPRIASATSGSRSTAGVASPA